MNQSVVGSPVDGQGVEYESGFFGFVCPIVSCKSLDATV